MKKIIAVFVLVLGLAFPCFAAWDSATDMQTLTVSAAFAQAQANFVALDAGTVTIAGVKTFTTSPIVPTPTTDYQPATKKYVDDAFKALYPIGSVYISTVSTNPATLLGFGTWTAFGTGRVMVGIDSTDASFDVAEETGGEKTHTLTLAEIPAHTHGIPVHRTSTDAQASYVGNGYVASVYATIDTNSAGSGTAHNVLQPYIVVYMFKRTA